MQEEHTYQQMKNDFQTIMKINVRCPRTDKILSFPICQA